MAESKINQKAVASAKTTAKTAFEQSRASKTGSTSRAGAMLKDIHVQGEKLTAEINALLHRLR